MCALPETRSISLDKDDASLDFLNQMIDTTTWSQDAICDVYLRLAKEAVMLRTGDYPILFVESVEDVRLFSNFVSSDETWRLLDQDANIRRLLGSPFITDMTAMRAIAKSESGLPYDTLAFCLLQNLKNEVLCDLARKIFTAVLHTWSPEGGELYEWHLEIQAGKITTIRKMPLVRNLGFHFSHSLF